MCRAFQCGYTGYTVVCDRISFELRGSFCTRGRSEPPVPHSGYHPSPRTAGSRREMEAVGSLPVALLLFPPFLKSLDPIVSLRLALEATRSLLVSLHSESGVVAGLSSTEGVRDGVFVP